MKYFLFFLPALLMSCANDPDHKSSAKALTVKESVESIWKQHWYDGNAEVNIYETQQARYRDIHPGETVLIFVTEDFLTKKQVKNESYSESPSTSVLKTNLIRKFTTGIYDYSIMNSVFTPVEKKQYPSTLKITTSSQDWCGHGFFQLNLEKNNYRVSQYSYFEKEGDRQYNTPALLTEDELFNRLRMSPQDIPNGSIEILPGTIFTRLKHSDFKPYRADIKSAPYTGSDFTETSLLSLSVYYPDFDRRLEIVYKADFPYQIVGWTDTYSEFNQLPKKSITRLKHSKRLPYWSQHDLEHADLRKELFQ